MPYINNSKSDACATSSCAAQNSLAIILLAIVLTSTSAHAQAPANGTTVFRCIDLNGVVSFADAPCKRSTSHRLRIEHSLIQSAPISMGEQQRLRALEIRLKDKRQQYSDDRRTSSKQKLAERGATAERCKRAKTGLAQIRQRKRRGYPVQQAQRIDNEEAELRGAISTHCDQ